MSSCSLHYQIFFHQVLRDLTKKDLYNWKNRVFLPASYLSNYSQYIFVITLKIEIFPFFLKPEFISVLFFLKEFPCNKTDHGVNLLHLQQIILSLHNAYSCYPFSWHYTQLLLVFGVYFFCKECITFVKMIFLKYGRNICMLQFFQYKKKRYCQCLRSLYPT